jgi:hypothetical protein
LESHPGCYEHSRPPRASEVPSLLPSEKFHERSIPIFVVRVHICASLYEQVYALRAGIMIGHVWPVGINRDLGGIR